MTASGLPGYPTSHPDIRPRLFTKRWDAGWIRHPDDDLRGRSGVFLYRKTLTLSEIPPTLLVHVSADQRYRLFVNGVSVSWGPARGDFGHWRYETIDLAPYLRAGENVLTAVVWWIHPDPAPMAQMTNEAAFLLQANDEEQGAAVVNTPDGWKVLRDDAYTFTDEASALRSYCVVGPGEVFDASRHPWGWQDAGFIDSGWADAVVIGRRAIGHGAPDAESPWWLSPRTIPAMEESPMQVGRVVRTEGINAPPSDWPQAGSLTIPAGTRAVLLFDHGVETCAFPEITVSGGAGATVRLAYSEALFNEKGKGNRNEVEGRVMRGYADTWRLDGGEGRLLRPLWWKTFRYAELTIETGDAPVTIDRLQAAYTGYPFVERGRIDAPEIADLPALWANGVRTARLCAHESYMDCPYYEQLQYVGDTRIQTLVSLYAFGDHRLFRNALAQIDDSRLANGLTQSRYPSRLPQVIAGFSLWYVGMIRDYWWHVPNDDAFIDGLLQGARGVLHWFRDRLRPDGLLGPLQWWCFVDWCETWPMGEPPGAHEGGSAVMTLQYVIALRDLADVVESFGHLKEADAYRREAKRIGRAVRDLCFDRKRNLVADTPEKTTFSQHASIFAILAGALPEKREKAAMQALLADPTLTPASFYCRFYLNRALAAVGMADDWLSTLGPWRTMLDLGLTTWAEKPEPVRSDCHAWSAAPNYEFLATLLGVQPAAPGFSAVALLPALGELTEASGVVPHPRGEIRVSYRRSKGDKLEVEYALPPGIEGFVEWKGDHAPLRRRKGTVTLRAKKGRKD